MVWHTIYRRPEAARSWCQEDDGMKERNYSYSLINDDLVIYELKKVNDTKYKDGVMYTFRCMSADGDTLFAVENSHGKPHIHLKGRKEDVDWDWQTSLWKFKEMLVEHEKRIRQR